MKCCLFTFWLSNQMIGSSILIWRINLLHFDAFKQNKLIQLRKKGLFTHGYIQYMSPFHCLKWSKYDHSYLKLHLEISAWSISVLTLNFGCTFWSPLHLGHPLELWSTHSVKGVSNLLILNACSVSHNT